MATLLHLSNLESSHLPYPAWSVNLCQISVSSLSQHCDSLSSILLLHGKSLVLPSGYITRWTRRLLLNHIVVSSTYTETLSHWYISTASILAMQRSASHKLPKLCLITTPGERAWAGLRQAYCIGVGAQHSAKLLGNTLWNWIFTHQAYIRLRERSSCWCHVHRFPLHQARHHPTPVFKSMKVPRQLLTVTNVLVTLLLQEAS